MKTKKRFRIMVERRKEVLGSKGPRVLRGGVGNCSEQSVKSGVRGGVQTTGSLSEWPPSYRTHADWQARSDEWKTLEEPPEPPLLWTLE